jgi:hypothetical protein
MARWSQGYWRALVLVLAPTHARTIKRRHTHAPSQVWALTPPLVSPTPLHDIPLPRASSWPRKVPGCSTSVPPTTSVLRGSAAAA